MAPITWQNISIPDFSGVSDIYKNAGLAFDKAGSALKDVLDQHIKVRNENWDAKAKQNTQNILAQRAGITNFGELQQAMATGPQGVGIQYNADELNKGSESLLNNLKTRLTTNAYVAGEAAASAGQSKEAGVRAIYDSLRANNVDADTAAATAKNFGDTMGIQMESQWAAEEDQLATSGLTKFREDEKLDMDKALANIGKEAKAAGMSDTRVERAKSKLLASINAVVEQNNKIAELNVASEGDMIKGKANDALADIDGTIAAYDKYLEETLPNGSGALNSAKEFSEKFDIERGDVVDVIMNQVGDGGILDYLNIGPSQFGSDAKDILQSALSELRSIDGMSNEDAIATMIMAFQDHREKNQSWFGSGLPITKSFIDTAVKKGKEMAEWRNIANKRDEVAATRERAATEYAERTELYLKERLRNEQLRLLNPKAVSHVGDPAAIKFRSKDLQDTLNRLRSKLSDTIQAKKKIEDEKPGVVRPAGDWPAEFPEHLRSSVVGNNIFNITVDPNLKVRQGKLPGVSTLK